MSVFILAALCISGPAQAAPAGGQVTSGTGIISQSGATTTISQQTQKLSLNWKSFDVAQQETVNSIRHFSGNGSGSVINDGTITAAEGGASRFSATQSKTGGRSWRNSARWRLAPARP